MTEIKEYPPGSFCWVDLGTTDEAAATEFYTALFGWTATAVPAGEVGTYTMLEKRSKNVSALYQMNQGMLEEGVPPHWLSYVSVVSADNTAAQAKELGATLLQEPFDVMDVGRMALIQDPQGATFALWQPKRHCGAELVNEAGTMCWNELYTNNVDGSTQFYTSLFGWSPKQSPGYTELRNGDRPAGGMIEIKPEWGPVPPNWAVYFAVADLDTSLEQAKSLGGTVEVPPMQVENVGRFAVLQDPQGAYFSVIQLDPGMV
jgi:predicted enzyme related to lactoylglutathione lyase